VLKKVGAFFVDKTVWFLISVYGHARVIALYDRRVTGLQDCKIARLQDCKMTEKDARTFPEITLQKSYGADIL
jgi:hypothetical protein